MGAICGGEGICGKCRVIVRAGEVTGDSTEFLTRDEIRRGYVLACQVIPRSDLVVEVPPESQLAGYVGIGQDSERFRDFTHRGGQRPPTELAPAGGEVRPRPARTHPGRSHRRPGAAACRRCVRQRPGPLQMGLKVTRELPGLLRTRESRRSSWSWKWDGRVTATVALRGEVNELLCVERGDTSTGTSAWPWTWARPPWWPTWWTSPRGITREAAAKYNSQIKFGADVISRINHARQPGGAEASSTTPSSRTWRP